jgi:Biotin-lipoyl like
MKNWLTTHGRGLSIGIVLLLMVGLLAYVALRAGPLAPVAVRLATVERRAISPSLFGIGTVQARFTHKIGPIVAGRVKQVTVQPGDFVKAGQLLGEMDPVDLNDRIGAPRSPRPRHSVTSNCWLCALSVPKRPTSSARNCSSHRHPCPPCAPTWMHRARNWCVPAPTMMAWCASAPTCA